jgi:hypothetical protein
VETIRLTRAEYRAITGLTADPHCIGAMLYGNGVPLIEYIYTDEPVEADFVEARRETRAAVEKLLHMPCLPECAKEQISELERLYDLASSPSTQSRPALTNGDGEEPSQSDPGQPDRS